MPELAAAHFRRLLEKLRQNRFNLVIQGALERVRAQKPADPLTTTARMGRLDRRLTEILRAESRLLSLKEQIEAAL